jgi:hypothetical protein
MNVNEPVPFLESRIRSQKLFKLGLKFNGTDFLYEDINFHWTDLVCMSDEEFDKAYKGAVNRKKVLEQEQAGKNKGVTS